MFNELIEIVMRIVGSERNMFFYLLLAIVMILLFKDFKGGNKNV